MTLPEMLGHASPSGRLCGMCKSLLFKLPVPGTWFACKRCDTRSY